MRDDLKAKLQVAVEQLESVKIALGIALEDTTDLYYANVSDDIDEALQKIRKEET